MGLGNYNTARYYHDSATKLGLVDGPQSGIVTLRLPVSPANNTVVQVTPKAVPTPKASDKVVNESPRMNTTPQQQPISYSAPPAKAKKQIMQPQPSMTYIPKISSRSSSIDICSEASGSIGPLQGAFRTRLLAAPGDESVLAPIHCFVRKNVEIFAATPEDVAAPAPGRKTRVSIGQIGIRCLHCAKLSPKQRVKRAVCYPPTIMSIYHSVSNMKFDHFGACRGLPPHLKQEFCKLRESTNQMAGKKVNRKTTAQYYIDSAIQDLNLLDTPNGIRGRGSETTSSHLSSTGSVSINNGLALTNNLKECGMGMPELNRPGQQSQSNGMSVLMMAAV